MPDLRCVMINLDPDSAAKDARVMKTVVRLNQNNAGVYATVVRTGTIRVGDRVRVDSKFLAPPLSKHKILFNLDSHVVVVSSRNFHFDQHADRQCKGSKAEATWWQQAAARIVVHVWTDRAFEQQA